MMFDPNYSFEVFDLIPREQKTAVRRDWRDAHHWLHWRVPRILLAMLILVGAALLVL